MRGCGEPTRSTVPDRRTHGDIRSEPKTSPARADAARADVPRSHIPILNEGTRNGDEQPSDADRIRQ
jgi:hypothetical protein